MLDLLVRLVEQSLVMAEEWGSEVRYRLLETLRQYGAERLRDAGEEGAVRARHLEWFAALAEQAEDPLWGPDQVAWFDRLRVEVALLIARGRTNRQIAETLVIAEWTVDTHVRHIMNKLGVRSRAQVAAWAAEQKLDTPSS